MLPHPQRLDDHRPIRALCNSNLVHFSTKLQTNIPRSLVNVSYALDFPSGKIWVAEQLELIASRYLNRNASIVAQQVRETMLPNHNNNLKFITAMRPDPPTLGGHGKLVVPENTNWPGIIEETDIFSTFPDEAGRTKHAMGATAREEHGIKQEEGDVYGDSRSWDPRTQ